MRGTPLRVGVAVLLAGATLAVAACGDDNDESAVCSAYSQLQSDVDAVENLGSDSSLQDVEDAVSTVVSDVGDLQSAASSDPDLTAAVDDVSTSVDQLESTVGSISDAESAAAALGSLGPQLDGLNSSLNALESAASCE